MPTPNLKSNAENTIASGSRQVIEDNSISKNSGNSPSTITDNAAKFLNCLIEYNIIYAQVKCEQCNIMCQPRRKSSNQDGFVWQCSGCKNTRSIRKGTIFEGSKLALHELFRILDLWTVGVSGKQACDYLKTISSTSVYKWYKIFRQVVSQYMSTNEVIFSGSDILIDNIVQIDESQFGKKSKYHRGKAFNKYWVFGISQQSTHKCYLQIVKKRDRATLMEIIKKKVKPNSNMLIVSDGWSSYKTLQDEGYSHSVVVHKDEFVNSDGYHTNSIESIWAQFKTWINSMHGVRSNLYGNYTDEFCYRYNNAGGNRNDCKKHFMQLLKVE